MFFFLFIAVFTGKTPPSFIYAHAVAAEVAAAPAVLLVSEVEKQFVEFITFWKAALAS
jgi:hypothetical protein